MQQTCQRTHKLLQLSDWEKSTTDVLCTQNIKTNSYVAEKNKQDFSVADDAETEKKNRKNKTGKQLF